MTAKRLSERTRQLLPSSTQVLDAKVKELIAQGADVVNLGIGEPDFDTLPDAREGGVTAIREGFTRYTATAGIAPLRQAIAGWLGTQRGLDYRSDEIVVSNGAKQGLFNSLMALVDPGDEVIIQAPYWVSYPEMIKLAGGVPVIIETCAETGFKMKPEMVASRLTSRTRAIILNSPSNPTGVVYGREELTELAQLAVEHQLAVISDEIYDHLVYEDIEFVAFASLGPQVRELTVTVNGFSKTCAMTGWRIGYAAAPRWLAAAMTDVQAHTTSAASSISQRAALAALVRPQPLLEKMRLEFDARRRMTVARLAGIPGISLEVVPRGAFYLFANVAGLFGVNEDGQPIENSDRLARLLLEEAGVAVVPGSAFGAPNHVRISYATSLEQLESGMDRLLRFAHAHQPVSASTIRSG